MKIIQWTGLAMMGLCCAFAAPRKLHVYLVGDSTMADKRISAYPETGWGMVFSRFFDTATTVVYNTAQNGRSTQSFLDAGKWKPIVDSLQEGDLVLVQFGHNDEIPTKKSATTEAQFQQNLLLYVKETRSKGAIPILITPAARRHFDSTTGVLKDTHKVYAALVRKVAKENNVPLIDLDTESQALLRSYGPEHSKWLFNYLQPGEHPNYPDGVKDDTHFSEAGARKMAEIVYADLKTLQPGDMVNHFFKPTPKK